MDLHLKVVEARDIPKMDTIGKTDAYVVIRVGGQQQKTRVIDNSLNPRWDETFHFQNISQSTGILLKFYDKDVAADDQFGQLELNTNAFAVGKVVDNWYEIKGIKKRGGNVHLVIHVAPSGAPPFVQQQMPAPGMYPPQGAPGMYPPQGAPGMYPPQGAPGMYPPQPAPGMYPPQPAPGAYPPQPGAYPAQPAPGAYPPQPAPGMYPPQPAPGAHPPQPGAYPAQPAPGAYPGQAVYMTKDQAKAMKKMEKAEKKMEKKMEKEAKKAFKKMFK